MSTPSLNDSPLPSSTDVYPAWAGHFIANQTSPDSGSGFEKLSPHTGQVLGHVARGNNHDIDLAVEQAVAAFASWSQTNIVERSNLMRKLAQCLETETETIARIIHLETGKSLKDARGEVGAAVEMGYFIAGEGRRFYGRTTTSAVPNRSARTERQPVGIWGLIIAANTPLANVAWKVFPCLLAGNTAILKPSENTPYTALWLAEQFADLGLPAGVLSVVQGLGKEVGATLVDHPQVDGISFTGSVGVGQQIAQNAGKRLAKVCLELGGKNALLVCDDLDETGLDAAVEASVLSAFSNAGQRCASASRLIVMEGIYERFKAKLLTKTHRLKVGNQDIDDYGPVISAPQLGMMLKALEKAKRAGLHFLTGGYRIGSADEASNEYHGHCTADGYYLAPTILEDVPADAEISHTELFGPITCLYRAHSFTEGLTKVNDSLLGLTAAIHSQNLNRTETFVQRVRTGVVSVNGPTYGSEPHMPFGGLKHSGNGFREAGTEVLDVYSDWKTIYIKHAPGYN